MALPAPSSRNEITRSTIPVGSTRRPAFLSAGGRPDSAATTGTREICRAGLEAAKYVASSARTMETMMTAQGSWKIPIS